VFDTPLEKPRAITGITGTTGSYADFMGLTFGTGMVPVEPVNRSTVSLSAIG
jgi:hypothetical protein